jgi:hypothetical protein
MKSEEAKASGAATDDETDEISRHLLNQSTSSPVASPVRPGTSGQTSDCDHDADEDEDDGVSVSSASTLASRMSSASRISKASGTGQSGPNNKTRTMKKTGGLTVSGRASVTGSRSSRSSNRRRSSTMMAPARNNSSKEEADSGDDVLNAQDVSGHEGSGSPVAAKGATRGTPSGGRSVASNRINLISSGASVRSHKSHRSNKSFRSYHSTRSQLLSSSTLYPRYNRYTGKLLPSYQLKEDMSQLASLNIQQLCNIKRGNSSGRKETTVRRRFTDNRQQRDVSELLTVLTQQSHAEYNHISFLEKSQRSLFWRKLFQEKSSEFHVSSECFNYTDSSKSTSTSSQHS